MILKSNNFKAKILRKEDEIMTGIICGTGSSVPVHSLDNNDIAKLVDTSDEWIQERTGVVRRHIITDETTVSMAADAGRKALEDAQISAEEIDMILVSTISSDVVLPCTACEVQKILGAKNASCFDLSAACSGFVFAYHTAQAYIASGMCKTILIIGSESLSNLTDWEDRGTCILFGDGAGAAVVQAREGRNYKIAAHSDGAKGEALTCTSRYVKNWKELSEKDMYMKMDGRAVFQFAVKRVSEVIKEILEKNEMEIEEIDCFVLHQANRRIVESVAKRLGLPIEKFPMNLQEYGNTSSASIPILLDELNKAGKIKTGEKILMVGFGAGLSWGAAITEWIK